MSAERDSSVTERLRLNEVVNNIKVSLAFVDHDYEILIEPVERGEIDYDSLDHYIYKLDTEDPEKVRESYEKILAIVRSGNSFKEICSILSDERIKKFEELISDPLGDEDFDVLIETFKDRGAMPLNKDAVDELRKFRFKLNKNVDFVRYVPVEGEVGYFWEMSFEGSDGYIEIKKVDRSIALLEPKNEVSPQSIGQYIGSLLSKLKFW